jgi:murein DD-endopeptidase MepM/ murein hydrolase activator NlpD
MVDFLDTIDRDEACAACGTSVGGRRYVQSEASGWVSFCSEKCLRAAQSAQRKQRWRARRRAMKVATIGVAVAGACLAPHQGREGLRPPPAPRAPAAVSDADAVTAVPAGWFGPEWPPTDTNLLAALGRDAWIHPLAGPVRRMPRNDTRVFGAVRPGDRAVECRNGHCGVDLGGEIWGEHVRAVHDGVVEYVQRGANAQRGGEFVRIAHRGGTVITQYFHLAAIPRRIERGTLVRGGDVVGLVGDTGVKESPPHLHFSISIRPAPGRPEKYFDPEPLIALWPLRVPLEGSDRGLVTTLAQAGTPMGSMPLIAGRKRKLAQLKRAAAAAAATGDASGAATAPDDQPGPEPAVPESSGDE